MRKRNWLPSEDEEKGGRDGTGSSLFPSFLIFSLLQFARSLSLSILLFNTAIEPVANKYSCSSSWAVAVNVSCLYQTVCGSVLPSVCACVRVNVVYNDEA